MFQISEKASEAIKEYLKDVQNPHPIRIMMSGCGCSGPSLGMALDEPNENDQVFNEHGLTFLVDKELLNEAKQISIEFVESSTGSGFTITSALFNKGKDNTGCGSCCC
jgi:HesB-like selenoprotein